MKAIIIDDEQHVIDTIQMLVPWEQYGFEKIFTATSVDDACDILQQERPELAFLDVVLEDKLGSDVLLHINAQKLPTKTIIISGHDSYNFVRTMFLLGGIDYLLKPVEMFALRQAVEKAIVRIQQEQSEAESDFSLDKKLKTLFPDYQHGLMRKLFQEKLFDSAYKELCKQNPIFSQSTSCAVLFAGGAFLPLHQPNYPLQLSKLLSKIQYELESKNVGTVFQRSGPSPDICILLYAEIDSSIEYIGRLLNEFNQYYHYGLPLALGVSETLPFPTNMHDAFRQAISASKHIPIAPAVYLTRFSPEMKTPTIYVDIHAENGILSALLTNDRAQLSASVQELFVIKNSTPIHDRGVLEALWNTVTVLYEKACSYLSAVCGAKTNDARQASISLAELFDTTPEKTALRIENHALLLFLGLQSIGREYRINNSMKAVADWLELNYMKKFQRSQCAEIFHFNKDYMCRKFKEEYGIGMVNYLTNIRINHAKAYLTETDMQYQEIADAVGIFDSKYFAKLFKSETGVTPAEYRKQQRWTP